MLTAHTLAQYIDYLDTLRASGVTNMFGAPAYLARSFQIPAAVARHATVLWMRTFDHDVLPEVRARRALWPPHAVRSTDAEYAEVKDWYPPGT